MPDPQVQEFSPLLPEFFLLSLFRSQQERKEIKGKTLEEGEKIPALAGRAWAGLTEEKKKKYIDMSQAEKDKYVIAMDVWKKTNPVTVKAPVAAPVVKQVKKQVAPTVPEPPVDEHSSDSDNSDDSDSDDDSSSSDSDT
jgi:hypothetical protein